MVGDCQKLDYLKTRASMPLHVIVATGYDDTHALIADNDRETIQRCSHASLRAARSASGFPLPAMNVTFEIDWPATIPPLASMIAPALRDTVRWMHAPHGAPAAIFGAETFGLAALDRFEQELTAWRAGPPREAAMLLWIAIEKGGTGGGLFRRLFRDFLGEANALVPSPALAAAHAHYAALAEDWTSVGTTCGSGTLGDSVERLIAIVRREREGVGLLERTVE
jgi:hypothetical protein